jgi:hypothetical protein
MKKRSLRIGTMTVLSWARCAVLAACTTGVLAAHANADPGGRGAPHSAPMSALDQRVQLMARELVLDGAQQAELKLILQTQRAEVEKAWSDPSVPAPIRVGATQAIGEKTAERIRSMLNDTQREKYMKSHQHEAPVGAPGVDLQRWMKSARGESSMQRADASPSTTTQEK